MENRCYPMFDAPFMLSIFSKLDVLFTGHKKNSLLCIVINIKISIANKMEIFMFPLWLSMFIG